MKTVTKTTIAPFALILLGLNASAQTVKEVSTQSNAQVDTTHDIIKGMLEEMDSKVVKIAFSNSDYLLAMKKLNQDVSERLTTLEKQFKEEILIPANEAWAPYISVRDNPNYTDDQKTAQMDYLKIKISAVSTANQSKLKAMLKRVVTDILNRAIKTNHGDMVFPEQQRANYNLAFINPVDGYRYDALVRLAVGDPYISVKINRNEQGPQIEVKSAGWSTIHYCTRSVEWDAQVEKAQCMRDALYSEFNDALLNPSRYGDKLLENAEAINGLKIRYCASASCDLLMKSTLSNLVNKIYSIPQLSHYDDQWIQDSWSEKYLISKITVRQNPFDVNAEELEVTTLKDQNDSNKKRDSQIAELFRLLTKDKHFETCTLEVNDEKTKICNEFTSFSEIHSNCLTANELQILENKIQDIKLRDKSERINCLLNSVEVNHAK